MLCFINKLDDETEILLNKLMHYRKGLTFILNEDIDD